MYKKYRPKFTQKDWAYEWACVASFELTELFKYKRSFCLLINETAV